MTRQASHGHAFAEAQPTNHCRAVVRVDGDSGNDCEVEGGSGKAQAITSPIDATTESGIPVLKFT